MDYFAGAEHVIRRLAALPTYDDMSELSASDLKTIKSGSTSAPVTLSDAIEAHQRTHTNLMEQADRLEAALRLGNQLLTQAHPEAVPRLRQWIHTIQTRWTDVSIISFISSTPLLILRVHAKNLLHSYYYHCCCCYCTA